MKPIVNPWIVYWAERCEEIQIAFALFAILAIVVIGVCCLCWLLSGEAEYKPPRCFIVIAVLCLIISIFIPSKKTILTMITLNYITSDNIEKTGDTVDTVVDYVADKIEEILDSE